MVVPRPAIYIIRPRLPGDRQNIGLQSSQLPPTASLTMYARSAYWLALWLQLSGLGLAATSVVASTSTSSSVAFWPYQTFITQKSFFPPQLSINRTGETAEGYLLMTPMGAGSKDASALIMSDTGNLIWQSAVGSLQSSNFNLQTYYEEPVLTLWQGSIVTQIGRGYGAVTIMDTSYNTLYNVTADLDITTIDGSTWPSYLDAHESHISTSNTLVATIYNVTRADLRSVGGPAKGWLLDSMIIELDIETSEVLWTWAAADHLDKIPLTSSHYPLGTSGRDQLQSWDWFHVNSIEDYGDGYLVSSRHLWSVIYVDKKTGDITWVLDVRIPPISSTKDDRQLTSRHHF